MTKDEIRNVVETFKEDNAIDKIDYKELERAAEKQGYTLIYFSTITCDENTEKLLSALGLSLQAENSRGFTYASGEYRLIFINEDLSESEKTIVLAHELGHILCKHLNSTPVIGKDVTDEYEANEFAHFLLNPSYGDKVLSIFFRNKIAIILAALATVIVAVVVVTVMKAKFADDGSTRPYETTQIEEDSGKDETAFDATSEGQVASDSTYDNAAGDDSSTSYDTASSIAFSDGIGQNDIYGSASDTIKQSNTNATNTTSTTNATGTTKSASSTTASNSNKNSSKSTSASGKKAATNTTNTASTTKAASSTTASKSNQKSSTKSTSASETTLASGKKTLDGFENTQVFATVKGLTEKSFKSYNPSVTYDAENEIIKIIVSAPSGTSQALASKYKEVKPYWDDMCEKMRAYSEAVCDDCKEEGYYVSCAVLIVSDLNSEKCFYAALNGVQTYRVDD